MDIMQLKYFYALAQTQHMTRTAEQIHIAQPSLTQSMHRLEDELQVKLFRQSGRNIMLTECGRYLQQKIEPILAALNEIPEEIRAIAGERQHLLKINVLAASTLITDTIMQYQKAHSEMRFQIVQHSDCEDADLTIFTRERFHAPQKTNDRYYLFSEQIFLAVPRSSPYADRTDIALREMTGKSFIALAGSKELRAICDRYCIHAGFRPKVVFESESASAVQNLIGASIGVGFWPQYSWGKPNESEMVLLPISEPNCRRDIVVQLHNSCACREEAEAYFAYLKAYLEQMK